MKSKDNRYHVCIGKKEVIKKQKQKKNTFVVFRMLLPFFSSHNKK